MKTPLKIRTVALTASILATTSTLHLIARYALPERPNTLLALGTVLPTGQASSANACRSTKLFR